MESEYKNDLKKNDPYQQQDPYSSNANPYQQQDPYSSNANPYQQNQNPYQKQGNTNKQQDRKKSVEHIDAAIGVGVIGSSMLAATPALGLIGANVTGAASAAGLTSIAALGSVPVAGAMLLGGGAIVAGAVGATLGTKALYKGVKALSNGLNSNYPSNNNYATYKPQRAKEPSIIRNIYNKLNETNIKTTKYNNELKKDFMKGKDISARSKDILSLKNLSSKNKKTVKNLYSDNLIRESAKNNKGVVDKKFMSIKINEDAKEQGWSQSKTNEIKANVQKRIKHHIDKNNINQNHKVLSVKVKAKNRVKKSSNISGKSLNKPVNNIIKKPPVKQAPQQAHSRAEERGR